MRIRQRRGIGGTLNATDAQAAHYERQGCAQRRRDHRTAAEPGTSRTWATRKWSSANAQRCRHVKLDGWKLRDRAANEYPLSGTVAARGKLTVTMTEPSMPLNNNGDEVLLIDAGGVVRSAVAYGGFEARAGSWIKFDRGRLST